MKLKLMVEANADRDDVLIKLKATDTAYSNWTFRQCFQVKDVGAGWVTGVQRLWLPSGLCHQSQTAKSVLENISHFYLKF